MYKSCATFCILCYVIFYNNNNTNNNNNFYYITEKLFFFLTFVFAIFSDEAMQQQGLKCGLNHQPSAGRRIMSTSEP